jgi:D-xylose transport system ATP-binding protein
MKNITKAFPGVKALDGVDFSVKKGEIHALVGENGAGKSTLMKILSGVYPQGSFDGEIILGENKASFYNIKDSEAAGIAIIYQELALVSQLTVCENITLGNEICGGAGIIDWNAAFAKAAGALKRVGLKVSPAEKVVNLGVGEQQLVEIAKALSKHARILILDEPTASLTETEANNLAAILKELRNEGITCIYISHRLREVFELADTITVLRDGRTVCTVDKNDIDEEKLIARMVGRELKQIYPRKKRETGDTIFEVRNWSVFDRARGKKVVKDVSFTLRRGEILGFSGLVGAGRSELFMNIIKAAGENVSGELFLNGSPIGINNVGEAVENRIMLATEDRKRFGLVLSMDINKNISLASLDKISKRSVIDKNAEIQNSTRFAAELKIKTPSVEQLTGNLSGGNQQKVVIAKALMIKPQILILDEPTRGIDVGAKLEIYNIINELVDAGVGVIIVSSDLTEIIGMSDRVAVMHEGALKAVLDISEATQENIMRHATNAA